MEYDSATKRDQALPPATTRMNLEDIMLRERSQTQKVTCCRIPLMCNVQSRQKYTDRQREGGMTAGWDRVSVAGNENVLELGRGGGCTML